MAIAQGLPLRRLARQFAPLTKDALGRHKHGGHVAEAASKATAAVRVTAGNDLVRELRRQLRRARRLEKKATAAGDTRSAIAALQLQGQQLQFMGKLGGHSRHGATPAPGETIVEDEITIRRRLTSAVIGLGGPLVERVEAAAALLPAPARTED